ncbi:hypothetical protein [Endozoicomonas sp. 8E]|uniref:hypothetical protein n=1 Tax=Endozoicomonas sp. 8E TaxID=3035692 RepID=UPI0029391B59|nr:hypothetical protein [Endozoicomonas sp. 8E]WOG30170.1 hypothetical protein P6910_11145 [Endozoicomonas sp. 8E]
MGTIFLCRSSAILYTLLETAIARVLFTVAGADMMLLQGFIKKSDKTPAKILSWQKHAVMMYYGNRKEVSDE